MSSTINVEVAYALPNKQQIKQVQVALGTTALQAAQQSGLTEVFLDLDLAEADLGVFGKSVKADYVLREGDRVEIYRPLIIDPKEVRKQRAAKASVKK